MCVDFLKILWQDKNKTRILLRRIGMTFDDVIEAFMNSVETDKSGGTPVTYKRKIYVFQEYVNLKLEAKDVNFQSILSAMTKEQLVDSLAYYVTTYDVRYVTTAENYITVIGVFFDFIAFSYQWKNALFETKSKNMELKIAYEKKISELGLNVKEQVEPLNDDEAKKLLNICNNKIDNATIDEVINGAVNGNFSAYMSSLISKLVLLYGTKNNCINELKISDYDCKLNKIKINGFWVHLPDSFAIQMNKYLEFRRQILGMEEETRLFVDIRKGKRKLDNNKMFAVLKEVTGNVKATSIAKYGIIQMIKLGVPSHIIKEFTGYSNDVYQYCQEKVDEQNGILMTNEKSKLLDSALRKNNLYDKM